jgi:OFA family oxalate/formate antiporter-like MFS transporter
LRTWKWYALWAIFFHNVSAGLAIISDAKAMAASLGGASATLASAFVVMVAVADSTGRLFWHALSDRVGQSTVFQAMFFLQAAAFSLLPLLGAGSFAVFCALSFVALSCYGGGYGTMPAFVNAYYGSCDVGTIYASIITASGLAGFGVQLLLVLTADATGSYSPALYGTAVLMLVGAAIPLAIRPPGSPDKPGPP